MQRVWRWVFCCSGLTDTDLIEFYKTQVADELRCSGLTDTDLIESARANMSNSGRCSGLTDTDLIEFHSLMIN